MKQRYPYRRILLHAAFGCVLAMFATHGQASNSYIFGFSDALNCPACSVQLLLTTDAGPRTIAAIQRGVIISNVSNPFEQPAGEATSAYYAGHCTPPDCALSREYRNWFGFGLAGDYKTILGATLQIASPNPVPPFKSISLQSDSALYTLYGVPLAVVDQYFQSGLCCERFSDVGDGPAFGSRTLSRADQGTVISIPIDANGVMYLQQASKLFDPVQGRYGWGVLGGTLTLPAAPVPALSPICQALLAGLLIAAGALRDRRRKPASDQEIGH
jgi:hypothetical protein